MSRLLLAASCVLLLLPSVASAEELAAAPAAPAKKVLLVGVDGVRTDAIPAATVATNLHALVESGALCKHCDVLGSRPSHATTLSAPGWCTILRGVWPDKHGVLDGSYRDNRLAEYPSLFQRFQQVRPDGTAVAFVSWQQFVDPILGPADGLRLLVNGDEVGYEAADRAVTEAATKFLTEDDADLVFVYFGATDSAGHGYGFHPKAPKYTSALEVIDGQIGQVVAAMRNRPTYAKEDWLIILCTDHGGKGRDHGLGEDEPEIRDVFLLLNGPSVDPSAMPEEATNADVVATAFTHLKIPIDPDWGLDGRAVGLKTQP